MNSFVTKLMIVSLLASPAGFGQGSKKVAAEKATEYQLDTKASVIKWEGKKKFLPEAVPGNKHHGEIKLKDGKVHLASGIPSQGSFTIDMNTIDCKDLSGDMKGKLEGHLKSADFFDVANHATSSVVLKKATASTTPNQFNIEADVTIRGVTKAITFPATIVATGKSATAKGSLTLNRTDFKVSYNSDNRNAFAAGAALAKDKVIDDTIKIELDLVANAK